LTHALNADSSRSDQVRVDEQGFELAPGKSRDHDVYFFVYAGKRQPIGTKLSRGTNYKTIGDPLLSQIRRQLKLSSQQFGDFVDCPLTGEQYAEILISQGVVQKDKGT
jgi:hypothetical protein